ncbi:hypothetical protein EAH87_13405 [Sphingomonas koreensis]|nr:hypothetical protein EAH87_13405 [Sphingomonas koreensis]
MTPTQETALRHRAAHLALTWREDAIGPFEGRDAGDYATMIVAAHIAADESRLSLHRWIDAGRRAGMSWAEIGALIGISKQAAQQRFGGAGDTLVPEPGQHVVRLGANAFNEMAMLREEGAKGNELVDTGILTLVFQPTDRKWDYRRTTSVLANSDAMKREGWQYVSSWFIFHYFKRPLDE